MRLPAWIKRLILARPARPDEPTERQARYARFLGVTIPRGCTRRELSRLIDRALRG